MSTSTGGEPAQPGRTPDVLPRRPVSPPLPEQRMHPAGPEPGAPSPWSHRTPEAGPPSPPPEATGRRRRRARGPRITIAVLAVALLAVLGVGTYASVLANQWSDRSEELTAVADNLGVQVATTQQELEGALSELEAVRQQLSTAQGRIIELADEKAQVGDDRELQRQLADYQQRVSEAAGTVASALDQCIQGQQTIITALKDAVAQAPEDPTPSAEFLAFETEVQSVCDSAREANTALQVELSR